MERGGCCCYERKRNSHGKDHEPQYEEDRDHTDGSRGDKRADRGAHRHGPDREPRRRRRCERGDRAHGARAARTSAGRQGCGADPPSLGEHVAWARPEQQGARQLGDKRPEDGRRRGLDAHQHRRGVGGPDACRPRGSLRRVHGGGDATPRDDVPEREEDQDRERCRARQARGESRGRARRRHREDRVHGRPGQLPRGDPGVPGAGGGRRRFKDG